MRLMVFVETRDTVVSFESVWDALKIGKDAENLPNSVRTKTEVAIVGPPHTLSIT